jgi:hypothetical protein
MHGCIVKMAIDSKQRRISGRVALPDGFIAETGVVV